MTFILPANGKNSTLAVCRSAFVRGNESVFVVNVEFFPYFYEGLILYSMMNFALTEKPGTFYSSLY